MDTEKVELAKVIGKKAYSLFKSGKFLCAEAILVTINEVFNGGLTEKQAISLSAPFCEGLGQAGCLCGALSGAIMACGLILIDFPLWKRRNLARKISHILHNSFKMKNKATCCRILTKKVKDNRDKHVEQCANLTVYSAEIAANFILKEQPSLIYIALNMNEGTYKSPLNRVSSWIKGLL